MFDLDLPDPLAVATNTAARALQADGLESMFRTECWSDEALQAFVDQLHAHLVRSPMKIERIDCCGTTSRKLGFAVEAGVGFYTPAPGYTIPVIIDALPPKTIKVTIRPAAEHRVVRWC